MISSVFRRLLSIGLVILVSTAVTAWATLAFADQKSSPKIECKVDTEVIDHNCNSNNSNIEDSPVIQNPSDGDFESLAVVSTDPSDGENDVPVDMSEIKVTFNKKIDKNTVDTGSLALFANNCSNDVCNNPNIQDISVSGKSVTFTIENNDHFSPDTNYIASLLSSLQDEDGNFLDCANSKAIDSNCEWEFGTSSTTTEPVITPDPTSGPVGPSSDSLSENMTTSGPVGPSSDSLSENMTIDVFA
jgi:hypothetical protein